MTEVVVVADYASGTVWPMPRYERSTTSKEDVCWLREAAAAEALWPPNGTRKLARYPSVLHELKWCGT